MSSKVVFITGAPLATSLDWTEADLLQAFSEPLERFLGRINASISILDDSAVELLSWRSIPLDVEHVVTGFSQDHAWQAEYQGASFLTVSDMTSFVEESTEFLDGPSIISSETPSTDVLSHYYEHSYAIHEDIPSSQIPPNSALANNSYQSDGTSVRTSEASYLTDQDSFESVLDRKDEIPTAGRLHNLGEIPNAVYLNSIQPQTMTVDLIVGIISLPAPRAIHTRRGLAMELLEILVGDETKSGFAINFWLPSNNNRTGDLKSTLSGMRPQDIVLIKNVALSSFKGRVYGQSLRKDVTKVYLLHRNRLDKEDAGGCYRSIDLMGTSNDRQVQKTKLVKEWVSRFVGVAQTVSKGKRRRVLKEILPPDTQ